MLYSAHGLPKKIVARGDPYQAQVEMTAGAIAAGIGDSRVENVVCFQSRFGPLEWIGPATEDEIARAGDDGCRVVIFPLAFVSEHSETLVELDIEYEKLARNNGCKNYTRIEALGINDYFIDGLSNLILNKDEYRYKNNLYPPKNRCPSNFTKCPCLN